MSADLIVRGHRVVTSDGIGPASIHIRNGRIAAVGLPGDIPVGSKVFEAGESVVMPGLVDTHVHCNEPGRTDWEGFSSATRAAAAGGATTLVEMPLNSIPATTTRDAFRAKLKAARGQCWTDVGFWGGLVPGNAPELRGLLEDGVFGFKCFLVSSGVPEFGHVTGPDLRAALPELARLGAPLLVHAELPGPIESAARAGGTDSPARYSTWLAARPREAENQAIALLLKLSREYGAWVHVVHLSSSDALGLLRQAKQEGAPVTVETCPHYLALAAEEIPDGATSFKCAPPIRERENCERLWSALGDGVIDLVVSDHSPCPPEMKRGPGGDFLRAWGGISSLQLGLSVVWTQARQRGYRLEQVAEWMCRAPARLAGLGKRKGAIAPGYDADLVVWNPEASFCVDAALLHHRHKLTPYAGRVLHGVVEATFLRGEVIHRQGSFSVGPIGAILRRGEC